MRITFVIDVPESPRVGIGYGQSQRFYPLQEGLDYLTAINEWHLSRRNFPPLYQSGVRYHTEEPGFEEWWDIPTVLAHGWGDCEDLGCWRVAELRKAGIRATPTYKAKKIRGIWLVHILARFPDGALEDPSKILGMKGEYQ